MTPRSSDRRQLCVRLRIELSSDWISRTRVLANLNIRPVLVDVTHRRVQLVIHVMNLIPNAAECPRCRAKSPDVANFIRRIPLPEVRGVLVRVQHGRSRRRSPQSGPRRSATSDSHGSPPTRGTGADRTTRTSKVAVTSDPESALLREIETLREVVEDLRASAIHWRDLYEAAARRRAETEEQLKDR
mgnify:CR=1 FL=1